MEKLIFSLVLLLTTKIIYLITGRNRRQIARIPKGMAILCQPPGQRYVAYAVGVFQLLFVAFFLVLYIKDGAPAEARQMWSLLVITSILICMLLIFSGNVAGRDCVYFNSREVRIEKPFRKSRTFQWEEIRKVDGNFDNAVNLYLLDGTKVLTARLGMVNYDVFCDMIKKTCPEKIASYYRSHMYEESQKCILRYGSEYYLLAAMGIGILLIYMATLVPAAAENSIIQQFLQGDFSQRFALLFAPVCGVISIVFLVVHSYDLSPANVHDIHFLKDVKFQFHDCCILGDRAYLSAELQQDLFSSVGIKLEVPYRLNMKNWRPTFKPYAKARKRIETNFSQLCDHFMLFRNYAKQTPGLFTRIIGKISAFTVLQYINYVNNRPIGWVKYALN